ncbi:MAG: hypothetical protein LBT80_01730 [Lactobacillaceae bacterium]|jgi:hypothetical protein|nr:hypothetical protein [Lactobacillaceae bacterium]
MDNNQRPKNSIFATLGLLLSAVSLFATKQQWILATLGIVFGVLTLIHARKVVLSNTSLMAGVVAIALGAIAILASRAGIF